MPSVAAVSAWPAPVHISRRWRGKRSASAPAGTPTKNSGNMRMLIATPTSNGEFVSSSVSPAEHDGFAHHPDGVEEHRDAEPAKVGQAEEDESKDAPNRAVESAPCPSDDRPLCCSTPATRSITCSC